MTLRTRVIPVLLLRHQSLVKTQRFGSFTYVGDPCNTVRIFNELEVDELFFLDIAATNDAAPPNFELLADIANECFMPLAYGGGVQHAEHAKRILGIGFEKIVLNSCAVAKPKLITELANQHGSQAVVVSIDIKHGWGAQPRVRTHAGGRSTTWHPVQWAKEVERRGAGEILLTSIEREGSWSGFDLELISSVSQAVSIPVVAHGGAGSIEHIRQAVSRGASAVALGSMVVFQKKGMGVLVSFPETGNLDDELKRSL